MGVRERVRVRTVMPPPPRRPTRHHPRYSPPGPTGRSPLSMPNPSWNARTRYPQLTNASTTARLSPRRLSSPQMAPCSTHRQRPLHHHPRRTLGPSSRRAGHRAYATADTAIDLLSARNQGPNQWRHLWFRTLVLVLGIKVRG